MKVKEQIRTRREQLGMSVEELSKRIGVSHQAVRHWESGRSFPGKSKAPDVEAALSFRIDWTEGIQSRLDRPAAVELMDADDIDMLIHIRKLPPNIKRIMSALAEAYADALSGRTQMLEAIKEPEPTHAVKRKPAVKTRRKIAG